MKKSVQKNVYEDKEPTVKLWTIQHEEAYRKFEETGILRADERYLFCKDTCRYAYDWISDQMIARIGPPPVADIKYPIWAWYQWEGKRKRRDLRCSGYAKRGTPLVQIEFEVPVKDILLSDFDVWHYVLNYFYIPENDSDDDAFSNKHKEACKLNWSVEFENSDPRLLQMLSEIRESWSKVFELEKAFERGFYAKDFQSIQATLWQITMKQVCKVEYFLAK